MSERNFPLQRFYFGLLKDLRSDSGKPLALAKTAGITPDQMAESLSLGRLEPPTPENTSSDMPAAMGLFRGQRVDYMLTIAQMNSAGLPQLLYILLDGTVMAWVGGNFTPFLGLAHSDMPVFDTQRDNLTPFTLASPQPADADTQMEWMQELLLYCQDDMKVVEGLLTALIQSNNIAITNAELSLEKRLHFVEALASLLPIPARTVLTFATNVIKPENSTAQIKFFAKDVAVPSGHVAFDWESAELTPAKYERHDYARFIVSQLRLDPSQVVEQTESLARTASWRAVRKENLSSALHWVSRRAKIDSALRAHQPADRDTVATILREDPTLTDELRVIYSTYLLSMGLALHEWKDTDSLPAIAAGHRDVAEGIFSELRERGNQGHGLDVYDLVEHWLLAVPEAKSLPWQQALHNAVFAHLKTQTENGTPESIASFIYRMCNADRDLQLDKIAQRVVTQILPLAHRSPQIAQAVLILAADYLPSGTFQELVGDIELVKKLPRPQQKALALLQPEVNSTIQPLYAIAEAAVSVPPQFQALITVRLIELALHLRRTELIGDRELGLLLQISDARQAERFKYVVKYLIDEFSQPARIKQLGPSGLGLLPQLYFIVGSVEEGIRLLEHYQNTIFTIERLASFADLIGEIFLRIDLPAQELATVMIGFENSQIRPEPRARAFCAALINQNWDYRMEGLARALTTLLYSDPQLLRVVGLQNALRLLEFQVDRSYTMDALRVATSLMNAALKMGENGPPLLVKVWQQLQAKTELRKSGIELLRRYIRQLPPDVSAPLPGYFSQQIDREVGEALYTTRLFRIITGGYNLITLTVIIRMTDKLLKDLATSYHESKELPTINRLRHDLDAMSGGLTEGERDQLTRNIVAICQLIFQLGLQKPPRKGWVSGNTTIRIAGATNQTPTPSKTAPKGIMKGILKEARETPPQTPTEFLTWLGLNFTDNFVTDLGLERASAAHLLAERSAAMFYRESIELLDFLKRLATAFPPDGMQEFSVENLKSELDTLWGEIHLSDQKSIEPALATETQEIALLLRIMASKANDRVVSDSGIGKQLETGRRQPANELEALRWVSGYFGRKHQN